MSTTHDLTLDPRRPGARFSGSCSCGSRVEGCSTAGMVHGWHATHVDDAGGVRRPAFVPATALRPGDTIPDVDGDDRPALAVVVTVDHVDGHRSVRLGVDSATGRRISILVPASRTYEVER